MVSWRREMSPLWWGRVIFHVDDVDEFYKHRAIAAGLSPAAEPKDAPWGERFPISDPSDTTSALPRELGTEGRRGRMTFDSGEDRCAGFPAGFFDRVDQSPDREFYLEPRLVAHIDERAIAAVGELYRDLKIGGKVLDLMGSLD